MMCTSPRRRHRSLISPRATLLAGTTASVASLLLTACPGGEGPDRDVLEEDANCELVTWYQDADADGFGDPDGEVRACAAPADMVDNADDCDDTDAAVFPGALEVCNDKDDDCDELIDSADDDLDATTLRTFYRDQDDDSHGDAAQSIEACTTPAGHVSSPDDCDDRLASVHPGAVEICNSIDDDCDTFIDDADDSIDFSGRPVTYEDQDNDGYGTGSGMQQCFSNSGASQAGDCDDGSSAVNPGATEICDGIDNDCDGNVDGGEAGRAVCEAAAGVFAGAYTARATEKLGSTIINDMRCAGAITLQIDPASSPSLQGSATCDRGGGLDLFDRQQISTFVGDVSPDGVVRGQVEHVFNGSLVRTYGFTGTIEGDGLTLSATGTLLPHPQSAVPWQVTLDVTAAR